MIFVFMASFTPLFIAERGGKLYYTNVSECLVSMFAGSGTNSFKLSHLLWRTRQRVMLYLTEVYTD